MEKQTPFQQIAALLKTVKEIAEQNNVPFTVTVIDPEEGGANVLNATYANGKKSEDRSDSELEAHRRLVVVHKAQHHLLDLPSELGSMLAMEIEEKASVWNRLHDAISPSQTVN